MPELPQFKNEEEWVEFFDTHDMGEYLYDMIPVDPKQFRVVRRPKASIRLELQRKTLEQVRDLAKRKRKSPEKLLEQWLNQRVREELAAQKV
jgi:hypothetical protein